ncbi:Uncharacterised protein [[Clostridium] sordellii]|uniref:hypothetical protein n=1 Tax=Paraclostridium sordellii TaxID=1505 RepID=UPI0005E0CAB6|nr:hypothetical protein [Paeniclostridium sordellii]CEQ01645.1 Uncharacterised protein [[Clostridium] sordellii] [Paeniclostridium sordellii]
MKYKTWINNKNMWEMDRVFNEIYNIKNIHSTGTLTNLKEGNKYDTYVFFGDEDYCVSRTFEVECLKVEVNNNGFEQAFISIEEYMEV